jgi:hypothetical protein
MHGEMIMKYALAILSLMLSGCINSDCGNTVVAEAPSPNGKWIATHFERACGATTPFAQIVSLRQSSQPFDGDKDDNIVFVMKGEPKIRVSWQSDSSLKIERPLIRDDIFSSLVDYKGIAVSFSP